MKSKIVIAILVTISLFASAFGHDLFLRLDSYFVRVNEKVSIKILNGSFRTSEGAVAFDRLKDLSVVSPLDVRTSPKETDFTKNETTSHVNVETKEAGNYVVGLSAMPREIDLDGKDFNEYLEHDGIPDTLMERRKNKELDKKVRELYSKHVKTIFQAGNKQTESYKVVLGYPVEIVPQSNPYGAKPGDSIGFLCLREGKPLVNQFVMTGYEDGNGKLITGKNVRTDKNGIARVNVNAAGKWYVKFINMTKLNDPKINYESKWATLSFELR
ncbi:MAG: DUF4198 domain-containing protein [Acidobacteriota bacterium]